MSGVKQGSISKIERGGQGTTTFTTQLANTLGVRTDWLANGSGPMYPDSSNVEPVDYDLSQRIPIISSVQAGEWCQTEDPFPPGVGDDYTINPEHGGKRCFALRVSGDSMTAPAGAAKTFPEGILVIVDPDIQDPPSGSFVVAKLPNTNEATFKQLIIDAGKTYLKPLNPTYPMIEFISDDEAHICGKVIAATWDKL